MMPNRLLLIASENKRLEEIATRNRLTQPLVQRYVAGETLEEALTVTEQLNARGVSVSLDLLGEAVHDLATSNAATDEYVRAIVGMTSRTRDSTISVKLSQLGIVVSKPAAEANLRRLLTLARENEVTVEVDMEHSSCGRDTLDVFRRILEEYAETRLAVQAYMRRTPEDLFTFAGTRPRIRLVKGAFDEAVDIAIHDAADVTAQYNYLSGWALQHLPDPAFGTHDDNCIKSVQQSAVALALDKQAFEFQMLYGVRRSLQDHLVDEGYRVRVYLPFGSQWYPYLTRRMAERPANLLLFLRSLVRG